MLHGSTDMREKHVVIPIGEIDVGAYLSEHEASGCHGALASHGIVNIVETRPYDIIRA